MCDIFNLFNKTNFNINDYIVSKIFSEYNKIKTKKNIFNYFFFKYITGLFSKIFVRTLRFSGVFCLKSMNL